MDVDFAPKGLGKEQSGVGSALNKVFKGGGPNSMEGLALALLAAADSSAICRTPTTS